LHLFIYFFYRYNRLDGRVGEAHEESWFPYHTLSPEVQSYAWIVSYWTKGHNVA